MASYSIPYDSKIGASPESRAAVAAGFWLTSTATFFAPRSSATKRAAAEYTCTLQPLKYLAFG